MVKNRKSAKPGTEEYSVPLKVTAETVRDLGISPEKVKKRLIGNRWERVYLVKTTQEVFEAYMRPLWTESKRKDRESRCFVSGKGGKLIRCPDNRKCEECKYADKVCREENRPASIETLAENGIEPAQGSFEDEADSGLELKYLIDRLTEINPRYGRILEMLYDNYTQEEIAKALGMKQRTVSDEIRKTRAIAQRLHLGKG